jgi:hypothetical protein
MSDTQGGTTSTTNRNALAAGDTGGGIYPDEGSMVSALTLKGGGLNTTTPGAREVGLYAEVSSQTGIGIYANSENGPGILGRGKGAGIIGYSDHTVGVSGESPNAAGVSGSSTNQAGVVGSSINGAGIEGFGSNGPALRGGSSGGVGLQVEGYVQIQSDAVGQATLPHGQTTVTVSTNAATPASNILLTPLADPEARLWVSRAQGSFTINSSEAPASDLAIAYLVIN